MRKSIIAWIMLLLFSCTDNHLEISGNGNSNYEIVIQPVADSTIQLAAQELSRYLEQISGVNIPVTSVEKRDPAKHAIFVGIEPVAGASSPHGIGYHVEDQDFHIYGGSPISTRYAVYRFLEKEMGCMWLSPTAETIPGSRRITLHPDIRYSYTPQIETRTVHSSLFYENHTFADKLGVTYEAFPGYAPGAGVHTFHRFMPEHSFYRAHPEYYALRNGKRLTTQLCLSNEDVLRIVIDSVRALFSRYPDAGIISVSQDDNTQFCQCGQCSVIDEQEGSPSGSMIRFVNSVAEHFPDKRISTLAYQYTRKPCKTKPVANVLVTLCSIECDRSKPIEQGCSDFANDLKGWKELTQNIRIWDYTTQFTNFLAPFPNLHTLRPNMELFRNSHAKWVFEQHSHHPSELFELRSYLTAQLLWDPDRDPDQIIENFCTAYYQEAAPFILEYITTTHEEIRKVPEFFLFLYGDPSQGFESFLAPDLLNRYDELYRSAEEAVAHKPEVLERVRIARLSTHYAILEASRKGMGPYKLSPEIKSRLEAFHTICESAGITLMNEMRYSVAEYIQSYEKAVQRASLPNLAAEKPVMLLTRPKKYANEDPRVLTDGSLGGNSFFSNWLGFEGNHMEAVIDLGQSAEVSHIQTAFLKVTNHVVFFPEWVEASWSTDNKSYLAIERKKTDHPLKNGDKVNDIEYYNFQFPPVRARYIKLHAQNLELAPEWHHASGLPSWIFCDEVIVY